MPKWLKPKLPERPAGDTINQLCELASLKVAIRQMCNKDEYHDDGMSSVKSNLAVKMAKVTNEIHQARKKFR